MHSRNIRLALTVSLAALAAGAANAQAFNGTTGAAPTTTTTNGTPTATTTVPNPLTAVTTTVQPQTVNSTTAPTTTAVSTTVNGVTYTGDVTVSGTGSQAQTVTSIRTVVFDASTPPNIVSDTEVTNAPVPTGAATITAVSAAGTVGDDLLANNYQATLSTSGTPTAAGAVVATENSTTVAPTGVTYAQRVGTATYNPSTGQVTVALPTAATSSTTVGSSGLTTTGGVTAATGTFSGGVSARTFTANVGGAANDPAINAGGGRIVGVANGTSANDAVNLSQLNAVRDGAAAALQAQVATLNGRIDNVQQEADAGTAIAVAMGGGYFLPGKKIALNVNYGNYRGESAIAGNLGVLVTDNVALNAGVATGFNGRGGTAFRVGGSIGF